MNNIQKYPAYKDSGVEWLGEIPEHWEVTKLKMITSFINRGVTPNYVEISNYKVINQATFSKGYFDLVNIKYTKDKDFTGLNFSKGIVERNDILLASTGGGVLGKVAFVDFDDNTFQADSHVTIIRGTEPEFMSKYYYYILSISYELINGILAQGSTNQTELQRDWLINFKFPVPTFSEQTTISAYLDIKTSQIESAIDIKQKQIELLKERRQILIHRAVIRGLNPDVKLKDSGVEWIGEIPEGWEVKPLRYIGKSQNGISKGAEYFGKGFPFVNYGDVYKDITLPLNVVGLANSSIEDRKQYSVIEGDIFFTRTSETVEEIGYASICMQTIENATFSGFIIRVRPTIGILDKGFSKYYFRSQTHRAFFVKEMNLVIRASLSQELLKKMPVLLPPINEQIAIAKSLDNSTSKISTAISLKEKEIEKLKEYKSVLINAAVSGKIKIK